MMAFMIGSRLLGGRASAAGWLATLPVAGLAAARLVRFDRHPVLSMANAGTPFVYLPAYAGLVAGVVSRRKALVALSVGVVAAHVIWTRPEVRRAERPAPGAPGTRLRVVSSNVRFYSSDSTPLGRELAALGADVLVLQELSPEHLMLIKAAGAFDAFPYSYVDARAGSFGAGIWSRYPISDGETWAPGGLPMVKAVVDVEGTRVQVFDVHVRAPVRRRWIPLYRSQMAELTAAVPACPLPVIMAGDFNSTYGLQPFRGLLATGLRDAHVVAGRGLWATTWPRGVPLMARLFRLDHILVSPALGVFDARV